MHIICHVVTFVMRGLYEHISGRIIENIVKEHIMEESYAELCLY